jgi:hypothetical protein
MDFLDWMCNVFTIISFGTLWQYFRQFKQLFEVETGNRINLNDVHTIKAVSCSIPFRCYNAYLSVVSRWCISSLLRPSSTKFAWETRHLSSRREISLSV